MNRSVQRSPRCAGKKTAQATVFGWIRTEMRRIFRFPQILVKISSTICTIFHETTWSAQEDLPLQKRIRISTKLSFRAFQ